MWSEVALCISIENVKGQCYVVEKENGFVFTFHLCSHNESLEVKIMSILLQILGKCQYTLIYGKAVLSRENHL